MTPLATHASDSALDRELPDELTTLEHLLQEQHFTTTRRASATGLPGVHIALDESHSADVFVRPTGCRLPYMLEVGNGFWSFQKRGDVIGALYELLSHSTGASFRMQPAT